MRLTSIPLIIWKVAEHFCLSKKHWCVRTKSRIELFTGFESIKQTYQFHMIKWTKKDAQETIISYDHDIYIVLTTSEKEETTLRFRTLPKHDGNLYSSPQENGTQILIS